MDPQTQFGVCYAVITVFCLIFSVMMLLRTSKDLGSEREVFYFRSLVSAFIIFCITDTIWCLGNYCLVPIPDVVMYALSAVGTAGLAFACFFWYCFGETRLGGRAVSKPWQLVLAALPLAVLLVLYLTTYWTHVMFYYVDTPVERMQAGPFYAGSITLMGLYIFVVSSHSALRAAREKSPALRRQFLSYVAFAVTPIAAGIFDAIVPNMPVIAPSLFMSVFLVFLTLRESQIYNDSLTGLNNRRRADDYLSQAIADASAENPLTLFMIDVNFFKEINDTQGHVEGDHALRVVAEGIRTTCEDTRAFAARWGGDEFMVIAENSQAYTPDEFAARIEDAVYAQCQEQHICYDLHISTGFSQCSDPTMRASKLIEEADAMLYENKLRVHQAAEEAKKRGVA